MAIPEPDAHFYIDNARPEEVAWVLRSLQDDVALTPMEISQKVASSGYAMQSDKTYSSRRLYDLGLAHLPEHSRQTQYVISATGEKAREILLTDPELFWDLMHYLHYTLWDDDPRTRKLLWSYRTCCNILWNERRLVPTSTMATGVQAQMRKEFPDLDYTARKGARFDGSAAGRCYNWLGHLVPAPFGEKVLQPRVHGRYELSLLALDHAYRTQGYRYGDPVILDDALLDQIARVFFLDTLCCRELLGLAARVTRAIAMRDTFAGTSVSLLAPYGVLNL